MTNRYVQSLAINSSGHIFAGAWSGALFRSTNNGDNWTQVNTGLTFLPGISSLAINSSGDVLVGTFGAGILRSIDNGTSYTLVGLPISSFGVGTLTGNTFGHIFAGTWELWGNGGVFQSTDNGASWTLLGLPNPFTAGFGSNKSGANPRSSFTRKVLHSTRDIIQRSRVPNTSLNHEVGVSALAVNASDHIFTATAVFRASYVFRSTNNGTSWTRVDTGSYGFGVSSLAINSAGQIFAAANAGIYRSIDNGDNWILLAGSPPSASRLAINPNGHIFAGTGSGVFRSTNGGTSWNSVNTGLTNRYIQSLAINSSGHIFAGTYVGGVFRSTDNGDNWTLLLGSPSTRDLAINSGGHIFAAADSGIFRSTNNGDSWTQINAGLTDISVYAVTINSSGYIFAATGTGVFRSVESTTSVREMPGEVPTAFALGQNYPNPFNPSTRIRFDVPAGQAGVSGFGLASLKVYDLLGREVATLVNEEVNPGSYEVTWYAGGFSSGVYLYRLTAGSFVESRKLVLLR